MQTAELFRNAGVVGTRGAGLPGHVKANAHVDYVIANGAECKARVSRLTCSATVIAVCLLLGCGARKEVAPPKPATKDSENSPAKTETQATNAAERVEGTLTVNGKSVVLNHVYAWTSKSAFDEKKTDIHVTIVDRPLSDEKYKGAMGLMSDNDAQGLELTIDDSKRIIGAQVYHSALQHRYFSSSGTLLFEPNTFDNSTVEGKVRTDGPSETFGDKWECNVSFRVTVQQSN